VRKGLPAAGHATEILKCHCEEPQATKQSTVRSADCFASARNGHNGKK